MNDQEQQQKRMALLALATIPFVLAVPPVLALYIGSWLDKQFGTFFWMPFLLILGGLAGVKECYRLIKKYGDRKL